MSQVKSAYNFVPAPTEDQVFKPNWADKVSHDIPFEDGESGEIEIQIVAETPIFIRNGSAKNNSDHEFSNAIIQGEKKYFIPSTSLKGMTRNVLEIMSFSRLNKSLVNDDRYSFRDLSPGSEYMNSYSSNNVKAGWLKEDDNGNWIVNECDFNHVHHSEIDSILGTNFRKSFLNKDPEKKDASFKYDQCKGKDLFSTFGVKTSKSKPKGLAIFDSTGKRGTFVFTGQSGPRKESNGQKPSGKAHEFVFYDGIKSAYELSEKQVRDFKFIYSDNDKNNISPDWKFWREKLEKGEKIPVFFNLEGTRIKHFGLSFMYKLPYEHSVHEMLPIANYSEESDLSTTIFGFSTKEESVKGRVFFSHALAEKAAPMNTFKEILGGPKASFTPFYVEQGDSRKNASYQQKGSIKGFKRYPVHTDIAKINYSDDQLKNEKVFTQFTPLGKGAVFNAKIRFHNLKQIELGALVSALSFHNQNGSFYHSIGGAKSLGFGCVKISVIDIQRFTNSLQVFEYTMNSHCQLKLKCDWLVSPQINELFSTSSQPSTKEIEEKLISPSVGIERRNGTQDNEFIQIKKEHKHLTRYSSINPSVGLTSLLTKEVIQQWEKDRIENEQRKSLEKLELEREFSNLIFTANKALDSFDFEESYNLYNKAMKIKNDGGLQEFIRLIELRKKEKIELDAFTSASSINTLEGYANFLIVYPVSKFKEEINQLISKLKANAGLPDRLRNMLDTEKFFKECEQWMRKLPNKSLVGSGFERDVEDKICSLAKQDLSNPKTSKNWQNNYYKNKVLLFLGDEMTNKLFQKLNS